MCRDIQFLGNQPLRITTVSLSNLSMPKQIFAKPLEIILTGPHQTCVSARKYYCIHKKSYEIERGEVFRKTWFLCESWWAGWLHQTFEENLSLYLLYDYQIFYSTSSLQNRQSFSKKQSEVHRTPRPLNNLGEHSIQTVSQQLNWYIRQGWWLCKELISNIFSIVRTPITFNDMDEWIW